MERMFPRLTGTRRTDAPANDGGGRGAACKPGMATLKNGSKGFWRFPGHGRPASEGANDREPTRPEKRRREAAFRSDLEHFLTSDALSGGLGQRS